MAFLTYNEQEQAHINFLRAEGVDVDRLQVGTTDVIRCREVGQIDGRPHGELAYKTNSNELANGQLGLVTWCRGRNGPKNFSTYGAWPIGEDASIFSKEAIAQQAERDLQEHENAARRAYGFWKHSLLTGGSDYLDRKGVGAYGICFRNDDKYGRVAVIPMRDIDGKLWSYQLLNPTADASTPNKFFATGARVDNLFHFLRPVVDGEPFGVAESYVTAATCFELTGIPTVCVFSSNYLVSGSLILRERYASSKIILFADNDKHLGPKNIGLKKALEAKIALKDNVSIAVPDFGSIDASKDASDWNDLVRLKGVAEAKRQLKARGILKE